MTRIALILMFAAGAVGCRDTGGGRSPYSFVGISGRLFLADGKPAANVRIKLIPAGLSDGYEGLPAEAVTNGDGSFSPITDGIPRIYFGRYAVVAEPMHEENPLEPEKVLRIPARYRDPATTDRFIEVNKSSSRNTVVILGPE